MQDINMLRNIAIVGHGNCGKSSIAEAMLFTSGKIKRLGRIDDGNSAMDFDEEEIRRGISITSSFHNYSWKKHDVFLVDTPGDDNFLNETMVATSIVDGAVFTIGAVLGVKGQTAKFADFIDEKTLPCIIHINKMDRERADFARTLGEIKAALPLNAVVLHLPIGAEDGFRGLVDVATGKAYLFNENQDGNLTETDLPGDMADDLEYYRESLMENVAETDDDLIEKFLEDGELSDEDLIAGLKKGVATGDLVPVTVGSATTNKGTASLLDAINMLLPSPLDRPSQVGTVPGTDDLIERGAADDDFSALVFKTMADPYAGRLTIFRVWSGVLSGDSFFNSSKNKSERFGQLFLPEGKENRPVDEVIPGMIVAVAKLKETTTGDTICAESAKIVYEASEPLKPVISYAVVAEKDEEKLFSSLTRMLDEDLTLKLSREEQTKEVLISGMGQVHLEVIGAKIKSKFGVEMGLSLPKIPYKETIKGSARVQGKHKKQSGGRGQYGDCVIEISKTDTEESHFEFEDKIVGGVIPQQYRPAVEKGILEAMEKGVLAGYPVVNIKVALVDGSFHNVDSSEMAFKIAGSLAFKKGIEEAGLALLEPVMNMTVKVSKEFVGDVMGDLNSRRGKVMGMDSEGKNELINAQVPMSEIQRYATDLTAMTGGRGSFEVEFSHYEEMPIQIADKIVAQVEKD